MEPMLHDDLEQDIGEDILYQKDASFSAELDLGPETEQPSTTKTSTSRQTLSKTIWPSSTTIQVRFDIGLEHTEGMLYWECVENE